MTTFTGRSPVSTTFTGRQAIAITKTIAPIITGIWSDIATWTETGKFWNDSGDATGTVFTGRTIPA